MAVGWNAIPDPEGRLIFDIEDFDRRPNGGFLRDNLALF